MSYDRDVIVIGGGPAGLSAAVRARFIKRYKCVPCSTMLLETSEPGGLAAWHGCMLTGPSWKVDRRELLDKLLGDVYALNIEIKKDRAVRILDKGLLKEVHTASGRIYTCLCVIIATGIKALINERQYLGRGLEVTSMGYQFMTERLQEILSRKWKPGLVVMGSPKLVNLIPLIRSLNHDHSHLTFVLEGTGEEDRDIKYGWVQGFYGQEKLRGLLLDSGDGSMKIPCSKVVLDFNSYELYPVRGVSWGGYGTEPSFIPTDPDMHTHVPGILAAGDVTRGGYNSLARALAQGLTAGLSAYRYVYRLKFNEFPPLFAYRPTDFQLQKGFKELPSLRKELRPFALVEKDRLRLGLNTQWPELIPELNGQKNIRQIALKLGADQGELMGVLFGLMEKKMLTFHLEV